MKFDKAVELFTAMPNEQSILLSGPPGVGKCLGEGTPILLADGRVVTVEQIVTGDQLMGPDGKARTVLSTTTGRSPLYRIDPIKGESWVCNDVHVMTLVNTDSSEIIDIQLDQWHTASQWFRDRHKLFSIGVDSFKGEVVPPPVDPYFLGVWFGDGHRHLKTFADGSQAIAKICVSKPDQKIRDICQTTADNWKATLRIDGKKGNPNFHIVTDRGQDNRLLRVMRDLVGSDIEIPDMIRRGSCEVRRQFLAGFLDTDGELANNCYVITQKRSDWARSLWWIARSLGLCATFTERRARNQFGFEGVYSVVTISGNTDQIPLRIPRKQAKPRKQRKVATRTGFTTTPIGVGDYYGFTLDEDGRFLLGDFTVTHNTVLAIQVGERMRKPGGPEPVIEVRDLCSHLPEDLLGLPWRVNPIEGQTDENGEPLPINPLASVTYYAPPTWLQRLSVPGAVGVLVLDDLGAAAPAVQTAAFKLVLQRQSGDCKLSPGVKIIATTNRKEDKSGATVLPAALRNRCCIQELDVDPQTWCQWYDQQDLPGDVSAFIWFSPGKLSTLPKEGSKDRVGAFATPRTWEMTGRSLQAAKANDAVFDVAAGLVGEGIAYEFAAFVKLRADIPDPRAVLLDPKKELPKPPRRDEPDRTVAIVTALAEHAATLSNERNALGKRIPELFLRAAAWVTQQGREYASAGVLTYASKNGNVNALIKAATQHKDDEELKPFLAHLRAALNPNA